MPRQKQGSQPKAVIFDVGNVLFHWDPRFLYERLIEDDQALDAFLANVVTHDWHFQHDAGRPFAETSAELIAQYPEHEALIRAFGPRFNETKGPNVDGILDLIDELDGRGVPLFCITNFSGEFFPPFRDAHPELFRHFRDIVVSGDEKLIKPDPAIYHLALRRFGLAAEEAVFIDDRADNIAAAVALGIHGICFSDVPSARTDLTQLGLLA